MGLFVGSAKLRDNTPFIVGIMFHGCLRLTNTKSSS